MCSQHPGEAATGWLLKTDALGNILWQKIYARRTADGRNQFNDIMQTGTEALRQRVSATFCAYDAALVIRWSKHSAEATAVRHPRRRTVIG
jgi:hypothetical protein